jgi:hypothetical protein
MRISSTFVGSAFSAVLVAACGSTVLVTDGEGGSGGSSDTATSGKSTSANTSSAKTTNATNVATSNVSNGTAVTSVASGMFYCDEIGVCEGDGVTWNSGCTECAAFGPNPPALDGSACAEQYFICFGNGDPSCMSAPEPECCLLYQCLDACDFDASGFLDVGPELDCFCTNDGSQCVRPQQPGTCLGDYEAGLDPAIEWSVCIYEEHCPSSCGF